MFQWPLIVVLVVSTFVGGVCPALQKEGHHNGEENVVSKETNTTGVSNNDTNKTIESSIKMADDKKGNRNETLSPTPSDNSTDVHPTSMQKTIDDGKRNCNSSKESTDMLNCKVQPHDDDEIIERNSSATEPTNTTSVASNKTEASTESHKDAPGEDSEKESGKKTTATVVPLNHTETTDKITYDVASTEADRSKHTNDSEVSGTDSKHDTNPTESSISSIAPLLTDEAVANADTEDVVGAVKSIDQGSNSKQMPSGLIALVTAISFAVAIAIVYIGMIVWRRYIEYRYGHRELLVNELEFDTNDLRHFEL